MEEVRGKVKYNCLFFRVLFRERGILSFFHAGKMTTHREKIPRFCCGYFRPCVCVPLFGPGRPVFKCAQLFPFELDDATSRGKIPRFCCGYFRLVCVCVCMYVLRRAMRQSCENSVLSLRLFPAYVCICLLCFVFGPGRAGFEVLINCGYFQI